MEVGAGNFQVRQNDETKAILARLDAEDAESPQPAAKENPLDSDDKLTLWKRLQGWLWEEKDLQSDSRIQMAIDEDFYDHQQWRAEDLAAMRARFQAPLVFNRIFLAANWLYGTAMRTKTDWDVKPREKDDEATAPKKKKLMKFVSDVNHAPYERLMSFKESITAGLSWIDHGICGDPDRELLEVQHETWRNVWHDSRNRRLVLKDGRYVFRERTLDLDYSLATWPEREEQLRESAQAADQRDRMIDASDPLRWDSSGNELQTGLGGTEDEASTGQRSGFGNALTTTEALRKRVRITECWYRVPVRKVILKGQVYDGKTFDKNDPLMVQALQEKACTARISIKQEVRYALWCDKGLLAEGTTPFKHDQFPLVPVICYRRKRDGTFYGVVRGMRDAQEDYNKRASKALHLLSTRGVLFETGAFGDDADEEEEARDELARPDFFLGYRAGKKVELKEGVQLADAHLDMMDRDGAHMEAASGVTNELMAIQTQAVSGVAIQKRQQQGQLTTTEPFEMFRLAQQMSGEITLSMIEQFYSEEKTFRITGERPDQHEFESINTPEYNPTKNAWEWKDDITKHKADFVISEIDYNESVRLAQYETTMQYMAKLAPELSIKFLDLAIELSDVPNKQEWLKRIRKINGEPDPDEGKTPEGQQAAAERQQKQAEQDAMAKRAQEAEVAKVEGEAAKAQGQAKLSQAQLADIITRAVKQAMEAAVMIVTTPGVTPAADVILDVAGVPQFPASMPTGGAAPPMPPAAAMPPRMMPAGPPQQPPGMPPVIPPA